MIGGYRSILNPSVYSEKHGITVIPTKPASAKQNLKGSQISSARTNDCLIKIGPPADSKTHSTFSGRVQTWGRCSRTLTCIGESKPGRCELANDKGADRPSYRSRYKQHTVVSSLF
ncbi:hypothetical protein IG631_11175 [Alternaria alternata]|nr:hypothetical protein IG631_11175 [Alternaria alternata]